MTTLVVVESPTKAKALRSYLGGGTIVRASMGHVRDLPTKEMGVDIAAGFRPTYRILRGKQKTVRELRAAIDKADMVVMATDPDREGEAIAWHIAQACRTQLKDKQVVRVRFHQITPAAVKEALARPQTLNMHLVDAQQARRVLDRLVGYEVSPLLWRAVAGPKGLSAGRVQSVALRLLVEREREIDAFVPQEYWTLDTELSRGEGPHFRARLWRVGKAKPDLKSADEVQTIVSDLNDADWRVAELDRRNRTRKPYPPYTTATLQRDASSRLRWPAKKTMSVAQQLYEGIKLPEEGTTGLITYMRTDSTAVSPEAAEEARQVIRQYYPDGLTKRTPVYRTKVKNAQEAHESIRPTSPCRTPREIRGALTADQDKLYTLIWRRFIASQMKPAVYRVTTVTVATSRQGQDLPYLFRATGRELIAVGFLAVYEVREERDDDQAPVQTLPPLEPGDPLICHELVPEQHWTKPPPHYTEASLIQLLEKEGIGRPSTFASILDTLYQRQYATKERGSLLPTPLGIVVWDLLAAHFDELFAVPFTATMENQLDEISNGRADWKQTIETMWTPLSHQVAQARTAVTDGPKVVVPGYGYKSRPQRGRGRRKRAEAIGEACPECGRSLVRRSGRHGAFVGCEGYPTCRFTRKIEASD